MTAPRTIDTRTQVTVSIEWDTCQAVTARAQRDGTDFSKVVQAALEAYLLPKGKENDAFRRSRP